ncbi:MAG: hypothetical protein WCG06_04775, partial [Candidatus Omnitrophota bacterium]
MTKISAKKAMLERLKSNRGSRGVGTACGVAVAAVGLALTPLWTRLSVFIYDWYNHLWFVGYFGEYFRSNLRMPDVVNVRDTVLFVSPVFYGFFFFPALGLISALTGPALAFRILVAVLFIFQFYSCRRLVLALSRDEFLSNAVAVLVTWSVYPLTNLYHRAAFPELISTMLAVINCCYFLLLILEFSQRTSRRDVLWFVLTLILAAGSHPITAFYYGLFLLGCAIAFGPQTAAAVKRAGPGRILLVFLPVGLCLAPWIAAIGLMGRHLFYASALKGVTLYPDIDTIAQRFSLLLPWADPRVELLGLARVDTPFLDTQVNMPLLLLIFFLGLATSSKNNGTEPGGRYWWAYGVGIGAFVAATLLSLPLGLFACLPKVFSIVEFAYRIVTYQNLALLLILAVLLSYRKFDFSKKSFRAGVWAVPALSLASLAIKLVHVEKVRDIGCEDKLEYAHKIRPDPG